MRFRWVLRWEWRGRPAALEETFTDAGPNSDGSGELRHDVFIEAGVLTIQIPRLHRVLPRRHGLLRHRLPLPPHV